jgi:RimJ/RimL family protein N-acetyltransferase
VKTRKYLADQGRDNFIPNMLTTARLQLRLWREEDLPAYAALNSDPRVMEYMPKLLNRAESDASAKRINEDLVRYGFGLWAVEAIGIADFIGFTGLAVTRFEAHFTPCMEIGWRLARDYWGFGFATEAARVACDYGFPQLGSPFTSGAA